MPRSSQSTPNQSTPITSHHEHTDCPKNPIGICSYALSTFHHLLSPAWLLLIFWLGWWSYHCGRLPEDWWFLAISINQRSPLWTYRCDWSAWNTCSHCRNWTLWFGRYTLCPAGGRFDETHLLTIFRWIIIPRCCAWSSDRHLATSRTPLFWCEGIGFLGGSIWRWRCCPRLLLHGMFMIRCLCLSPCFATSHLISISQGSTLPHPLLPSPTFLLPPPSSDL